MKTLLHKCSLEDLKRGTLPSVPNRVSIEEVLLSFDRSTDYGHAVFARDEQGTGGNWVEGWNLVGYNFYNPHFSGIVTLAHDPKTSDLYFFKQREVSIPGFRGLIASYNQNGLRGMLQEVKEQGIVGEKLGLHQGKNWKGNYARGTHKFYATIGDPKDLINELREHTLNFKPTIMKTPAFRS